MREKKCTRQSALIVARNVKYHSNLTEADLFTVESAIQKEETQEDFRLS
jgi:hypothetical protein